MFPNYLKNYPKMSVVLMQMIIIRYLTIQAIVDVPLCNKTEARLSDLINSTLETYKLPSDLLLFVEKLSNSNTTLLLQNCSDILTLKLYLYECATIPIKSDLPKPYYTALYAYVEMKYQILHHVTYIPKTNTDIILLTNSFATARLNPVLERKLHLYFFYYGNWLEKLTERNFPFNKYKNPRSLLLGMICELINDPLYRMFEREVIFFLILNNHTCFFIENYYSHTKQFDNLYNGFHGKYHNTDLEYTLKRPSVKSHFSSNVSKSENSNLEKNKQLNNSKSSNDIVMFQNFSITILNNKIFPNTSFVEIGNNSKIFLNFSIVNSIQLKQTNITDPHQTLFTTLKEYQTPEMTTQVSFLPSLNGNPVHTTRALAHNSSYVTNVEDSQVHFNDSQTIQILNVSVPAQTKTPLNNISAISSNISLVQEEVDKSPYDLRMLRLQTLDLGHVNATRSDINQNYQQIENQHIHNFTVWDIVEMDGPCKEGQQHVVKLNVQSLLTAIDEHVSNSSIELFRKLLNNVKSFPIEDYNARGELLRDLLPVISKEQTDPQIKKSIEDILDHVMLDGPGALPPKIKLECVNAPEENLKRSARRIRRVFNLQFD